MRKLLVTVKDYAVFVLLGVAFTSSLGWYVTTQKLEAQIAHREADHALYKAEQEAYTARALREKMEIERKNNERAEEADANYQSLLEQYNAGLVRYHAAQRSLSRSYLPGASEAPESSDGPGASTELPTTINILFEDAQICAVNTARLQAVQEWATSHTE